MAELGETSDTKALIPGSPEAIEENVVAVRGRGRSMEAAGNGLARIDSGGWEGTAGKEFAEKFTYEPPKWRRAGDAFEATAAALSTHADTLRWAQTQAGEAIHRWNQGQAATQQARAAHEQAVARADAQNKANAATGDPTVVTVAPFSDPGEQHRQAAREILNRARQQLTESGETAAATIRAQTEQAPEEPSWLEDVGGFLGEVGIGAWEGVTGIVDFAVTYSPTRLLYDAEGWADDTSTLAQGVLHAVQNPVEFGKALIDYDTWKQSPGRAIGHLIPDLAAAVATGGAAAVANRGRKGLKALEDVADDAPKRGGDGPVNKGAAGVELTVSQIEAAGGRVLGREVTVDAGGVRTRIDLYAETSSGQREFVEVKTGPHADLTPNQRQAYPVIEAEGGVPAGKRAAEAGLEPGEPIPPTPVRIVRQP